LAYGNLAAVPAGWSFGEGLFLSAAFQPVWPNSLTISPQAFSEKANINNHKRSNYQTARHGYSWCETNQVSSEIEANNKMRLVMGSVGSAREAAWSF
jgi:hypothetical protein